MVSHFIRDGCVLFQLEQLQVVLRYGRKYHTVILLSESLVEYQCIAQRRFEPVFDYLPFDALCCVSCVCFCYLPCSIVDFCQHHFQQFSNFGENIF